MIIAKSYRLFVGKSVEVSENKHRRVLIRDAAVGVYSVKNYLHTLCSYVFVVIIEMNAVDIYEFFIFLMQKNCMRAGSRTRTLIVKS